MNSTDYQVEQLKERVRELEQRIYEDVQELREYIDEKLERKPLTDEQIFEIWEKAMFINNGKNAVLNNQPFVHFARAIEAAHGIKE